MDATLKPGLFRTWYDELKIFSTKTQQGGILPHLEIGASMVTVFVSSYFAANLADTFAVILAYGPHAYFQEGLRVVDWKHGLLSNSAYLSLPGRLVEVPTTLILWLGAICTADFCSMIFQEIIRRNGRWAGTAFRVVGGAALLAFAVHLLSP